MYGSAKQHECGGQEGLHSAFPGQKRTATVVSNEHQSKDIKTMPQP